MSIHRHIAFWSQDTLIQLSTGHRNEGGYAAYDAYDCMYLKHANIEVLRALLPTTPRLLALFMVLRGSARYI